jgi:hypothetical protein
MKLFKSICLVVIILLVTVGSAWAVTNTFQSGGVDLKWSTTGNWDQSHVPLAGEDVVIPTGLVAVIDVARIPATTGTLGTITGTGTGQITLALDTNGNTGIYATSITPGTIGATGLINVTGTTGNTLTVGSGTYPCVLHTGTTTSSTCIFFNTTGILAATADITMEAAAAGRGIENELAGTVNYVGNITCASTTNNQSGIYNKVLGAVTVTGNITAGGGVGSHGVNNITTGALTINNSLITGGAGLTSYGVQSTNVAPTFNNVNMVSGTKSLGYFGYPPTWTPSPAVTNYIKVGTVTFAPINDGGTPILLPTTVLKDLVVGGGTQSITGTRTDCPAASALSTQQYGAGGTGITGSFVAPGAANVLSTANYGVSPGVGTYVVTPVAGVLDSVHFGDGSGSVGTYKEAAAADVKTGVHFGPASAYLGLLAGGGSMVEGTP